MTHHDWVVELTFATLDNLEDQTLTRLDEDGEPHDWFVSRRADGPGLQVVLYDTGDNPALLSKQAAEQAATWLDDHGIRGELIEIRVVTESQREAEAVAPTMPSLVSASGAAEILGVRRQRVHQLYKDNPRFPAPLVQLATGPVWDEKAIEWFKSVWERKPGRPAVAGRPNGSGVGTPKVSSMSSYLAKKPVKTSTSLSPRKPAQIAAKSTRRSADG